MEVTHETEKDKEGYRRKLPVLPKVVEILNKVLREPTIDGHLLEIVRRHLEMILNARELKKMSINLSCLEMQAGVVATAPCRAESIWHMIREEMRRPRKQTLETSNMRLVFVR